MPSLPVHFQTTMWSVIREARDDPDQALEYVIRRYRDPIYRYIRQRGLQDADAEDLVQEVFTRVCDEKFLDRADRDRGRFRTLLLAVTNNALASHWRRQGAKKRGGGEKVASLDQEEGDLYSQVREAKPEPQDESYHRLWVENLIQSALEKLVMDDRQYRTVRMFYFEGKSQKAIAEVLGRKEKDVENDLASARRRMRRWIAQQIAEYCSSRDEYEEEVIDLQKLL